MSEVHKPHSREKALKLAESIVAERDGYAADDWRLSMATALLDLEEQLEACEATREHNARVAHERGQSEARLREQFEALRYAAHYFVMHSDSDLAFDALVDALPPGVPNPANNPDSDELVVRDMANREVARIPAPHQDPVSGESRTAPGSPPGEAPGQLPGLRRGLARGASSPASEPGT